MEDAFRLELEAYATADEGNFTKWMNMDHPYMSGGSTGDYEWVREVRYREYAYGECLIPCDDDDIIAMEVDVKDTESDHFIGDILRDTTYNSVGHGCSFAWVGK